MNWPIESFINYKLITILQKEYENNTVFPELKHIFRCFKYFPPNKTKVVIIGQDPYYTKGKAMGLSFAVSRQEFLPPSLLNIIKEIRTDIGEGEVPRDLNHLTTQGVLLLNRTLTVIEGQPNSHREIWYGFAEKVVKFLSQNHTDIVFMLWGKNAQELVSHVDASHLILKAAHPSPFSANKGFFGCQHFSQCNRFLESKNKKPIEWVLTQEEF